MTEKKHEPTPSLGKPSSKRAIFTYQENKMLDQITTEIMEAWAKDLELIKQCHIKCHSMMIKNSHMHDKFEEHKQEVLHVIDMSRTIIEGYQQELIDQMKSLGFVARTIRIEESLKEIKKSLRPWYKKLFGIYD